MKIADPKFCRNFVVIFTLMRCTARIMKSMRTSPCQIAPTFNACGFINFLGSCLCPKCRFRLSEYARASPGASLKPHTSIGLPVMSCHRLSGIDAPSDPFFEFRPMQYRLVFCCRRDWILHQSNQDAFLPQKYRHFDSNTYRAVKG